MTTQIRKHESPAVTIPAQILERLQWPDGEDVELRIEADRLVICRSRRPDIRTLFDGYDGSCPPAEVDWGRPEGNEVW